MDHAADFDGRQVNEAAQLFDALSDKTRRAAVHALLTRPHGSGELARALSVSPQALTRHLRVLRKAGLVVIEGVEDDARQRIYHFDQRAFAPLRNWLDEAEQMWSEQLGAFKEFAEGQP